MARLVIFGERPGPNTDATRPLHPHTTTGAAAKLINLLGMTTEEYLRDTIRYNVVDNGRVSTRSENAKVRVLQRMAAERQTNPNPRFLFCGRETIACLGTGTRTWKWGEIKGDTMLIPHPSGRNLFYNSREDTDFIRRQLKEFLRDH